MRKLLFVLIFLFSQLVLQAQIDTSADDGEFSIIATDEGLRFIYNCDDTNFMFDLICDEFKPIEAENMLFMADDMLLQITPVPLRAIFGKMVHSLSDSLALIYHFAYEAREIRNTLSGHYQMKPEFIVSESGRLIYFWSFKMPGADGKDTDSLTHKIVIQMYATTRVGNRILMLSSALISKTEPGKVKEMFIGLLNSISTSKKRINPEKVRKELIERAKTKESENEEE
jgi:hypothetical protein